MPGRYYALAGNAGDDSDSRTVPSAVWLEEDWPERKLAVSLKVPTPCWSIKINDVYWVEEELLVIAHLSVKKDARCIQVISSARDEAKIRAPSGQAQYYILGKTWKWENKEAYTFISDLAEIAGKLKNARLIWRRDKGKGLSCLKTFEHTY